MIEGDSTRKQRLLDALRGTIPQPKPVPPDSLDAILGPASDELASELTRLLTGLTLDPINEYLATTAIGRLRQLYGARSQRPRFTDQLVAALSLLVEEFPILDGVPPLVKLDTGAYVHVGGEDPRAVFRYAPQHRSRFRQLWH